MELGLGPGSGLGLGLGRRKLTPTICCVAPGGRLTICADSPGDSTAPGVSTDAPGGRWPESTCLGLGLGLG